MAGEFDGRGKYDELAAPGQSPADVVRREKRRQEAIEDEGWVVVRWGWDEVREPRLLRTKLLRAFARAGAR